MKDDFFTGLFEQARKTANDVLNRVEKTLLDKDPETEDLQPQLEQLQAKYDELELTLAETMGVVQVLLDGEMRKKLTLSWEKFDNLQEPDVEIVFTDDGAGSVTIEIVQEL
jgi:hypothetical protein